jgi:hypothetical protein
MKRNRCNEARYERESVVTHIANSQHHVAEAVHVKNAIADNDNSLSRYYGP